MVSTEPPLLAYYRIEHPPSVFTEQYVVMQYNDIIQIDYEADNPDIVNCYVFSKRSNKITTKVINHRSNIAFVHELDYNEYFNTFPKYSVDIVDEDNEVLSLSSINDSRQYRVYLSGLYPNFHPATLAIPEITSLPRRMEKGDKIFNLVHTTADEEFIRRILQKIDCADYYILSLEDMKFKILEKSGITFDQIKEMLLSTPRH